MRDLSIRWQLTAAYVALLVVTLAASGVLVYRRAEAVMQAALLSDLERDVEFAWGSTIPLVKADVELTGGTFAKLLASRDTIASLYRPDGELLFADTAKLPKLPRTLPPPTVEELERARRGEQSTRIVTADGERVLLLVTPLDALPDRAVVVVERSDGAGWFKVAGEAGTASPAAVATVGVSLAATDANLAALRQILVLATVLAGAAGVALGTVLTRHFLRPLDQVSAAAQQIAAGDLGVRVAQTAPGLPQRGHELGRLAGAFDHMVEQLAKTVAAQRRFVADAAHELKTPLTAIGGMVEMLLLGADGGDPERRRRALVGIEREVGRLGRLVQDLLTLSRLEGAEGPSPPRAPVNLNALAAEVVQEAKLAAGGRELVLGATPAPPVVVAGDADRLKQVLLNLVDNAIKHTPPGGRVTVVCEARDGQAEVRVEDTGAGIPAEAIPRLFDRFYRVELGRDRKTGGAGLGLAIARAIVDAHGGSLTAASAGQGRGATFTLRLPLAAPRPPLRLVQGEREADAFAEPLPSAAGGLSETA